LNASYAAGGSRDELRPPEKSLVLLGTHRLHDPASLLFVIYLKKLSHHMGPDCS
jgi:hypothetical protein